LELISVNLGKERLLNRKDRVERTGIFKYPTNEAIRVTKLGLEGDVIASKKHHGGPDQAVYVYGGADYAWWSAELERPIEPGTFGENMTISGLESALFQVGDYLHLREVTLQVSAPRIPCGTFAARMKDPQWVKRFRQAERPGLYCRVIQEGRVRTGEPVSWEPYSGDTISVLEMYRDYYDKNKSEATLRRHLNAPVAVRARKALEKELQRLLNPLQA
jgi:MOSC domain-containing protein YiiM